ncbi:MAG: hypothetical protein WKF97_20535 [Chitinophagaceae bacterium]
MRYKWLFLLFVPASAFGQDKIIQHDSIPSLSQRFLYLKSPSSLGLLPQARYSHKTSKGSVFILPIDNMPCLVPDPALFKDMPNARPGEPPSYMPNTYPKYNVIPQKKQK